MLFIQVFWSPLNILRYPSTASGRWDLTVPSLLLISLTVPSLLLIWWSSQWWLPSSHDIPPRTKISTPSIDPPVPSTRPFSPWKSMCLAVLHEVWKSLRLSVAQSFLPQSSHQCTIAFQTWLQLRSGLLSVWLNPTTMDLCHGIPTLPSWYSSLSEMNKENRLHLSSSPAICEAIRKPLCIIHQSSCIMTVPWNFFFQLMPHHQHLWYFVLLLPLAMQHTLDQPQLSTTQPQVPCSWALHGEPLNLLVSLLNQATPGLVLGPHHFVVAVVVPPDSIAAATVMLQTLCPPPFPTVGRDYWDAVLLFLMIMCLPLTWHLLSTLTFRISAHWQGHHVSLKSLKPLPVISHILAIFAPWHGIQMMYPSALEFLLLLQCWMV